MSARNFCHAGTYCQYAAVEEAHLAKLPDGVDINTAGGVPLVGLTAWQALMEGKPHQGQRVLVLAASGGRGSFWKALPAARYNDSQRVR